MRKNPAGPAYTLSRVIPSVWSWYQIVDARWLLGILEDGRSRVPLGRVRGDVAAARRLAPEEVVPGPLGGVAGGDVAGPRVGTRPLRTRRSRRPRRRSRARGSRSGRGRCRSRVSRRIPAAVAAARPAGRVRPVERRVDWQQVGEVRGHRVSRVLAQLIDPFHADRRAMLRLDRERGRIEDDGSTLRYPRHRSPRRLLPAARPVGSAARTGGRRSRSSRCSCRLFTLILPARGMAGGTSSGVAYFGIDPGGSVGPGIGTGYGWSEPPRQEQRRSAGGTELDERASREPGIHFPTLRAPRR